MDAVFFEANLTILQQNLYTKLNLFSDRHSVPGRLLVPVIATLDCCFHIPKRVLVAIECLAFAAINLFGALLCKENYSTFMAIQCLEYGLGSLLCLPAVLAVTPFRLIYQIFKGIMDPRTVQCSSAHEYEQKQLDQLGSRKDNNFIQIFNLIPNPNDSTPALDGDVAVEDAEVSELP